MSTLSAARADNFYYPPGWDPSKESLSKHTGATKGRNQYEQKGIIRFEMPMDAWCLGCKRHVAKGVRFNAKKDNDGKYYSTTIWAFTMQCPSCTEKFVIKTDPKNSDYEFFSGIRRKVEEYDENEEDGARELSRTDHRDQEAEMVLKKDPIAKLERGQDDVRKAKGFVDEVDAARNRSETFWADDFEANKALRRRARTSRKEDAVRDKHASSLGLALDLLPTDASDTALARTVKFPSRPPANDAAAVRRRVAASSIFGKRTKRTQAAQTLDRRRIDSKSLALKQRVADPAPSKRPRLSKAAKALSHSRTGGSSASVF